MTHTPGLLHVIEQNERDKDARCVRLVDSNGVFALVIDEKYGERFAALWNMAERLGLSTEDIESGNVETKIKAAPDMLEALEEVMGELDVEGLPCPLCGRDLTIGHRRHCIWHVVESAVRKARGVTE
jgi:hypothetical protein